MDVEIRGIRDDVAELRAMIGDRSQPESVRGRLHQMEGLLRSAVMKRAPGSLLRRWQQMIIVIAAVATVAASWYAALAH